MAHRFLLRESDPVVTIIKLNVELKEHFKNRILDLFWSNPLVMIIKLNVKLREHFKNRILDLF